jgi:hypothetical protein
VSFGGGFALKLFPASLAHKTFYVPGAADDDDAGGWVIPELERNLRICIAEKAKKVAPYKSKYAEWWLVLDDRIGYALDASDREQFREAAIPAGHEFDRIILVSPFDHRHAFQIAPEFCDL